MGSVVDSYCKGCQYLSTVSGGRNCNYNYITGKLRGCPAGNGCIQHTGGKHAPPASKKSAEVNPKEAKPKQKKPVMTPEEAYERDKARKRENARLLREKSQGRQRAAIMAYKEATGDSNYEISKKIGVSESVVQKWTIEYSPANWEKLAILGIEKPEGL